MFPRNVYALNNQLLLRRDAEYGTSFALVASSNDDHLVASLDLAHRVSPKSLQVQVK
jgi:hypothetical protein